MNSKEFLRELTAFGVLGAFPQAVYAAGTGDDWKLAFRSVGFDPEAPGTQFLVVTSDVHCANAPHLDEHVALWNALEPKPSAVMVLGDLGAVNACFGHRPDAKYRVVAPTATRLAVLGSFRGKRKDPSVRETFAVSSDGTNWQPVARTGGAGDTWVFAIPETLRGGDVWFRIDAFGMDCDDALSGFAFLS